MNTIKGKCEICKKEVEINLPLSENEDWKCIDIIYSNRIKIYMFCCWDHRIYWDLYYDLIK